MRARIAVVSVSFLALVAATLVGACLATILHSAQSSAPSATEQLQAGWQAQEYQHIDNDGDLQSGYMTILDGSKWDSTGTYTTSTVEC
jgi:hypothetical protein